MEVALVTCEVGTDRGSAYRDNIFVMTSHFEMYSDTRCAGAGSHGT